VITTNLFLKIALISDAVYNTKRQTKGIPDFYSHLTKVTNFRVWLALPLHIDKPLLWAYPKALLTKDVYTVMVFHPF